MGNIGGVTGALKDILTGVTAETDDHVVLTLSAYDPPPATLDSVKLPAAYVFTGAGTYSSTYGEDEYMLSRRYSVRVAVLAENAASLRLRELHIRALLDAVVTQLMKYPTLDSLDNVIRMNVISDSGPIVLAEYDERFVGFEVTIETRELVSRTYAAGE